MKRKPKTCMWVEGLAKRPLELFPCGRIDPKVKVYEHGKLVGYVCVLHSMRASLFGYETGFGK